MFPGQLPRARPYVLAAYAEMAKDRGFRRLAGVASLAALPSDPGHYFRVVPEGYDASKKWPAVVFLHGWGGNFKFYPWWWSRFSEEHGVVVILPTYRMGGWWTERGVQNALGALDETAAELSLDPRRVFLAGHSNGGMGLWAVQRARPEAFAGLVSISGALLDVSDAKPAARVPVLCLAGGKDPNVPAAASRRAAEAIRAAGGRAEFEELPEADHFLMATDAEAVYGRLARFLGLRGRRTPTSTPGASRR